MAISRRAKSVLHSDADAEGKLRQRISELSDWLSEYGQGCQEKQAHIDAGSVERIYWHYGYLIALRDVVRLLDSQELELH